MTHNANMIANVLNLDQRVFLRCFAWMRRSFLPGSRELQCSARRNGPVNVAFLKAETLFIGKCSENGPLCFWVTARGRVGDVWGAGGGGLCQNLPLSVV